MKRPYVICHMASTVDGRIIAQNWGTDLSKYFKAYEKCHNSFDSQAWMVGRVTMEKDFTDGRHPDLVPATRKIRRSAFIGDRDATSYAIALDAGGKLGWTENEIDGDHIVEILTEAVSDDYLQYLQDRSISYIFAGRKNVNFATALEQLHKLFGIRTLMLEGGGHINGSLLNAGLIDELSLLILPLADGTAKTPTTFEVGDYLPSKPASPMKLIHVERLQHDILWLRYKFKR